MESRVDPDFLGEFLHKTGWPSPRDRAVSERMQIALSFFHKHLGSWIDLPLDATDKGYQKHGFSPFAFRIQGKVTKLTSAMQGIDFNHPVAEVNLTRGKRLLRYGKPGEPRGQPARGLWYAEPSVPASKLALPPDQTSPYPYEVAFPVEVLASTAGDMLVDWNMRADGPDRLIRGVDYHYRSGGGLQYVIPKADRALRPL